MRVREIGGVSVREKKSELKREGSELEREWERDRGVS